MSEKKSVADIQARHWREGTSFRLSKDDVKFVIKGAYCQGLGEYLGKGNKAYCQRCEKPFSHIRLFCSFNICAGCVRKAAIAATECRVGSE